MNFPWRRNNALAVIREYQNQGHRVYHVGPRVEGGHPPVQVEYIPPFAHDRRRPFQALPAPFPYEPMAKEVRSERITIDGDILR